MIELIELYQAYNASSVLTEYWPRYINNIVIILFKCFDNYIWYDVF